MTLSLPDLSSLAPQHEFLLLFIAAITLSKTPLRAPFKWAETFFHELSHGLMATATLGSFKKMELRFNGSGSAWTSGGSRILILLAGYFGAVSWGAIIYLAGKNIPNNNDFNLLYLLTGTLVLSCLLWARDIKTIIIIALIASTFTGCNLLAPYIELTLLVEFIGIYILQSAITAPLNLLDGKSEGDGAELAKITFILPEFFWIILWLAYGLWVSYYLWLNAGYEHFGGISWL